MTINCFKDKDPKNLIEILDILINSLDDKDKEYIKTCDLVLFSYYSGMCLRNTLNLWGDSLLKDWFINIGIFHPDDMSNIIITSLKRTLLGEDIKLTEQVQYFKDYWANYEENAEWTLNLDNGRIIKISSVTKE